MKTTVGTLIRQVLERAFNVGNVMKDLSEGHGQVTIERE